MRQISDIAPLNGSKPNVFKLPSQGFDHLKNRSRIPVGPIAQLLQGVRV